jgi:DNA-binding NarL/FixJ family response regulator
MVIDMWANLLSSNPKFEIAGTSLDGEKAFEEIIRILPDVVLMDITLPGMSGIELSKRIREKTPSIKILGVSMHTNIILIKQLLINGASGYVSKTSSFDEMTTAILTIHEGNRYICMVSICNVIPQAFLIHSCNCVDLAWNYGQDLINKVATPVKDCSA